MTDLLLVLPDFDTASYSHILPSLERALITANDILTLDPLDVARRASIPSAEVRRLKDDLSTQLHGQLAQCHTTGLADKDWALVSTLDPALDRLLGGGFPAGYLSEITGESAAGKTQFLLSLCLGVQLPPPHGLNRAALYITTEGPLQTPRLQQIITTNPLLSTLPTSDRPTLARIHSIKCPDLESQDHILTYQVPVAVDRHDIGLVIIDSVAANFRAEFDAPTTDDKRRIAFAARTKKLVKLGTQLRALAQKHNIAVVVANQVLDRFSPAAQFETNPSQSQSSSQPSRTPSSSVPPSLPLSSVAPAKKIDIGLTPHPLRNDHQQRFTTGWGVYSSATISSLPSNPTIPWSQQQHIHYHARFAKSPSLGLAWTAQLACRVVLLRSPVYKDHDYRLGIAEKEVARWRRGLNVVFAPWTAEGNDIGAEIEVWEGGVRLSAETTSDDNKQDDD